MAKKKGVKQKQGLAKLLGISAATLLLGAIIGFGIHCIPAVDDSINFGAETQVEQTADANANTNTDSTNAVE